MRKFANLFRRFLGIGSILRLEREQLTALKFNSTIIDSKWFIHKGISPGGYAVDYTFFYTLYRVLESFMPQNILEFGLGQSSKMIHQYAAFFKVNAITIEHDSNWSVFFEKSKVGDYAVNIKHLDLENIEYKGTSTQTFRNCVKELGGKKYDLILIDSPIALNKNYSRVEVIDIANSCLSDNFVIMIDDYNQKSIQNTAKEVFDVLKGKGVNFVYGIYKGEKDHILITSDNNNFLTTL